MPTAPGDAISSSEPPTARDQLLTVSNDREDVAVSPLGGEQEDEKDEGLPGSGKGGMVAEQLTSGGKTSMFVPVPYPPLTMSSKKGKLNEIQTRMKVFHWTIIKAIVLLVDIQ